MSLSLGIESGFKQIKSSRVRTTSTNHGYRLLSFLVASTLYNVWRLVDLLVKLVLTGVCDGCDGRTEPDE
jgi:IS4 transposase